MYSFKCDYSEGAHPRILKAMVEANLVQTDGYGEDQYCSKAREILKSVLACESVDIHFVPGGTQANLISISAFLRQYEAVIATNTGHIVTSETGSIEATGHKVISVLSPDGKMTPIMVEEVMAKHTDEHTVKPKMVYISNSTEIGTLYTLNELLALKETCKKYNLYFFMDGARLGSALTAKANDVKITDLCQILDAFYIGATKNGALFGEAICLVNDELKREFRFNIKQKGALFAKSKYLGIQFIELFSNNLYFALATHANKMAEMIKYGFQAAGYQLYSDSPTNQQFIIVSNAELEKIEENYIVYRWGAYDDNSFIIRLVTSWATQESKVLELLEYIKKIKE